MIERDFIQQKTKEYYIKQHIQRELKGAGISEITLKKIPLGEKIIVKTSRPSLIVGSKGSNIKMLTRTLKRDFKLENPQVEIAEVKDIFLDASIVAERIASSLERFGSARFKGTGHKMLQNVLNAGALGVEIMISGKIPGARAKRWRFYQGYLKKCGDVALTGVRSAKTFALLKSGVIGIQVSIMPPGLELPDFVEILEEPIQIIEEVDAKDTTKKSPKKKSAKKTKKDGNVEVDASKEPVDEKTDGSVEKKEEPAKTEESAPELVKEELAEGKEEPTPEPAKESQSREDANE
ncbi:TPA: 30S ribosomal protein S3 [Candidatus Woesearchaeota archaeon]|mgnify:CR=1 FL=1|nr:30S ribosomal protein S3 [archaeon]HIJ12017.1 30S ribosomal protein S3 [Candidatus Woesearchaeota archaeon]